VRSLVPLVFLALAAFFVADGRRALELPIPPASGVSVADLHLGPPRVPLAEPPTIQNGPFRQSCRECHQIFPTPEVPRSTRLQHTHIRLDHGRNDRCDNCHSRANRDRLVLRDGAERGYDEVPELCAQCHGTLYRDWQNGTHGRTSGSWDKSSGAQVRLTCTQCHDPHAPAFAPFVPLAGPNTLRMGRAAETEPGAAEAENPLERWKAHLLEENPVEESR
jgi:hypothetical protein